MRFLSKIKNNMRKKVSRMPRRPNMIPPSFRPRPFGPGHPLFDPPRNQPRPIFPRRPIQKGYKVDPRRRKPRGGSSIRDAIRRSEQQQFANPTIFGQPIGNFDFGNMPNFSIDDIMEMPQAPTQMPMTQDLPEVAPVGMMPQMRMGGMQDMQPRMMMAEGDEVFMDSSPEQMAFSIGVEIENLYKDYEEAVQSGDDQRAMMLNEQINDLEARRIEMMNQSRPQLAEGGEPFPDLSGDGQITRKDILIGQGVKFKAEGDEVKSFADYQPEGSLKGTFFDYIPDGYQVSSFLMDKFGQEAAQDPTIREMFEKEFKAARMAGKDVFEFMGKPYNTKTLEEVEGMRYGGEMERFQDGGEIDAMLSGMSSEEAGAMEDLEQMAPEMEMIDQLVMMVVQMIQQGASEEEVMMFLREQGLDDEDIGTVLQLVAEMAEAEAMPQDGIGAELEQLA